MKKWISVMLAIVILAVSACAALAEDNGSVMYVYTGNGKGLNVRSSMSLTEDNYITSLPYGTKVFTYGTPQPGWTYIEIGNISGYVMSRYLVKNKPAPYDGSSGSSASEADPRNFDTRAATTVEQINTLLISATAVTPYIVTVRPTRASGWVYMRWIPSRNAEQVATFAANKQLIVIAELKDWLQVQDPDSGKVGFVYKSYIQ